MVRVVLGTSVLAEDYSPPVIAFENILIYPGIYNDLSNALRDMRAINSRVWLSSGFRSYEEQSSMYQSCEQRKRSTGNPNVCLVGFPGCSEHQSGLAIDIFLLGPNYELMNLTKDLVSILNGYGFYQTIAGDPPHFYYSRGI